MSESQLITHFPRKTTNLTVVFRPKEIPDQFVLYLTTASVFQIQLPQDKNQFTRFQNGELSIKGSRSRTVSANFTQCVIDALTKLQPQPDQVFGVIQNESTSFTIVLVISINDPDNMEKLNFEIPILESQKSYPMIRTTTFNNSLKSHLNIQRDFTKIPSPTSPSITELSFIKPEIYSETTVINPDLSVNELTIALALRQPTESQINQYLSKLLCLDSHPVKHNTRITRPKEQNKFIIFAMLATARRNIWNERISERKLFHTKPFTEHTSNEQVPTLKECLKQGISTQTKSDVDPMLRLIFLLHSKSERKEIITTKQHDCTFLTNCPLTQDLSQYLLRFSDSYLIADAIEQCAAHQIYFRNFDQLNQ